MRRKNRNPLKSLADQVDGNRKAFAVSDSYPPKMRGDAWEPPEPPRIKGDTTITKDEDGGLVLWPEPPAEEAYFGLAGDLVRAIEPQSEASPVALLVQTLVSFGSIIGRTAHFSVESTAHYLNLFTVLVGQTAKGRKGTSWDRIRSVFAEVDPDWNERRIMTGLSSGEGLIWQVRDVILKREPIKERGRVTGYQEVETDPGERDKRLLVMEPEFAIVLRQIERQGNTLSAILRLAWDRGDLRAMAKNSPAQATGAHISIIGHITSEELQRYLSSTESASGFGNRFLWVAAKWSKLLPDGGVPVDLTAYVGWMRQAVDQARTVGTMQRDEAARQLWHEVYGDLSGDRPGLAGALTARAEAQTMRLACLYALLDCSPMIRLDHLRAALALWSYCDRSVRFIFGDSLGDEVADEILALLRQREKGMTRSEVGDHFGRNRPSGRIARALALVERYGLAHCRQENTGGRPAERWLAGTR